MNTPPLVERALATIARHRMIRTGERVLVAVSGGADSTALLDVLRIAAPRLGCTLAVGHLDHGLRGLEAARDAQWVRERALEADLPFLSGTEDVRALARRESRGLEEAGRAARRRFLERAAGELGASRIALGHHRDDQAEGVLMNLLRGSGISGLAAARPVSGRFVRPLLDASREQILDHLRERGLTWRHDPSNDDAEIPRNRIRHELMPLLALRFNPRVAEALARGAAILRDEDDLVASLATAWLDGHLEPRRNATDRRGDSAARVPRERLAALPVALARRVVRAALLRCGAPPRAIRFERVDEVVSLAAGRRTGARAVFGRGFEARIERDHVVFEPPRADSTAGAGRAGARTGRGAEPDGGGDAA